MGGPSRPSLWQARFDAAAAARSVRLFPPELSPVAARRPRAGRPRPRDPLAAARRADAEMSVGMKRISLAILIAAASGGGAAVASQGSGAITGLWSTGSQDGSVELYRCGAAICGKVNDAAPLRANPDQRAAKNPDRALRTRRIKGLVELRGFPGDPRAWTAGPDRKVCGAGKRGPVVITQ